MSSLAEDITAAKAAIHSMSHDLPLVAEQMSARLGNIQDKLARLISSSQDYGKLKVASLSPYTPRGLSDILLHLV